MVGLHPGAAVCVRPSAAGKLYGHPMPGPVPRFHKHLQFSSKHGPNRMPRQAYVQTTPTQPGESGAQRQRFVT